MNRAETQGRHIFRQLCNPTMLGARLTANDISVMARIMREGYFGNIEETKYHLAYIIGIEDYGVAPQPSHLQLATFRTGDIVSPLQSLRAFKEETLIETLKGSKLLPYIIDGYIHQVKEIKDDVTSRYHF